MLQDIQSTVKNDICHGQYYYEKMIDFSQFERDQRVFKQIGSDKFYHVRNNKG